MIRHASDRAALAMVAASCRVSEPADRAQAILPDVKMIYTTGYTRNAVVHNSQLDPGTEFLAKPFGIDRLAAKVRAVPDQT
ncbi:hypothetical protein [Novosphingobium sp.]|uniref:hypothetical protein n=1 Tax=unclassified Novosphingobium TaxID=2644732 RepID=UPI0028AE54A6|nr:hypothetical protein [Novosphingobium sp.]